MDYFEVGKYVNTHGLKGEIKILSNLSDSSAFFKVGNTIYIGDNKIPFTIKTYRKHQKYDMITFNEIDSFDEVLSYKGLKIYVNRDDTDVFLIEDIIGYKVYNNDIYIGDITEILKGVKYDFIVVGSKRIIIPYIDEFIVSVNSDKQEINTCYML
ncbi:MAG TPA: 16S rRNA processing protein RimM [Mollicutes bacterium]|nr:16S rRNA processing protein RimM [Mollicutes bacterium]